MVKYRFSYSRRNSELLNSLLGLPKNILKSGWANIYVTVIMALLILLPRQNKYMSIKLCYNLLWAIISKQTHFCTSQNHFYTLLQHDIRFLRCILDTHFSKWSNPKSILQFTGMNTSFGTLTLRYKKQFNGNMPPSSFKLNPKFGL